MKWSNVLFTVGMFIFWIIFTIIMFAPTIFGFFIYNVLEPVSFLEKLATIGVLGFFLTGIQIMLGFIWIWITILVIAFIFE